VLLALDGFLKPLILKILVWPDVERELERQHIGRARQWTWTLAIALPDSHFGVQGMTDIVVWLDVNCVAEVNIAQDKY
jgi:hypothetical protein